MSATLVLARLTWRRLWRGRMIWVSGLLGLLCVVFAALSFDQGASPESEWEETAQFLLRLPLVLAATMHLAPAVSDEVEGQTISYLWSRPVARPALLLGKLLAIVPFLAVVFGAVAAICWAILLQGEDPRALLRVELAVVAGSFAMGTLAAGVGAIFPRHPFIFVMGYVLVIEQIVSLIPQMQNVRNLSMAHHVVALAGLREDADLTTSAIGLFGLAAIFLVIGLRRVRTAEYIRADQ